MEALKPCLRESCYTCFQMAVGENYSREASNHGAQVFRFCQLDVDSMATTSLIECFMHLSKGYFLTKQDVNLVILTQTEELVTFKR